MAVEAPGPEGLAPEEGVKKVGAMQSEYAEEGRYMSGIYQV